MKQSNLDFNGIAFYGTVIETTLRKLIEILGQPQIDKINEPNKINAIWYMQTKKSIQFSIYDWKINKKLGLDDIVKFNIAGKSKKNTDYIAKQLKKLIN